MVFSLNKISYLELILLISIFFNALFLRLTVIYYFSSPPQSDAKEYHSIALNLISGYGYSLEPGRPTTKRPPLYPLFLASIYTLLNPDYRKALYVQAILHSILVFPIFNPNLSLAY